MYKEKRKIKIARDVKFKVVFQEIPKSVKRNAINLFQEDEVEEEEEDQAPERENGEDDEFEDAEETEVEDEKIANENQEQELRSKKNM